MPPRVNVQSSHHVRQVQGAFAGGLLPPAAIPNHVLDYLGKAESQDTRGASRHNGEVGHVSRDHSAGRDHGPDSDLRASWRDDCVGAYPGVVGDFKLTGSNRLHFYPSQFTVKEKWVGRKPVQGMVPEKDPYTRGN